MRLYEISAALERAIEGSYTVDDNGEVIFTPDDIEKIAELRENKLEACGLYIKGLEAECKAIYDEEQALKKRRAVLERKADSLREYVLDDMLRDGTVVNTARISMKPARTPAKVEVIDIHELPDRYIRVKTEPDKQAIRKAIDSGEEIPGAELSSGGWRLAVR